MKIVEVGQRWGHLEVIAHVGGDKVRLRCSCGVVVTWRVSKFLGGHYKSCGHLGLEMFRSYPVNYAKEDEDDTQSDDLVVSPTED